MQPYTDDHLEFGDELTLQLLELPLLSACAWIQILNDLKNVVLQAV